LLCTCVAVSLHYLLLSAFSWMLVEGWHIYRLLTDVFRKKQCGLLPYYLTGYGLPLLVVLPSIASSQAIGFRGYGSSEHCWLATEHGFIWAFSGPVAAVVTVNCLIFCLAMKVARHAKARNKDRDQGRVTTTLTWLKGSASLLAILGLSWVTGFLYMTQGMAWMGVPFTLLNSLQGLAIFLLHVAFNDQARKKLRSHLQRQFHILEFHSLSRNTTVKSTMRSHGSRGGGSTVRGRAVLARGQSDISILEEESSTFPSCTTVSVELEGCEAELDMSLGEDTVVTREVKCSGERNNNMAEEENQPQHQAQHPPQDQPQHQPHHQPHHQPQHQPQHHPETEPEPEPQPDY